MPCLNKVCSNIVNVVLQYQTPKVSIIQNRYIAVLLRFLQLALLVYVIGYSIYYKRGYQDFYSLSSSVLVKVKGIGVSHRTDIHRTIWDIADTVVPSQEMNAIFITTNAIETANQTQGICPEDYTVEDARCNKHLDCKKDKPLHLGNGVMTGKCVLSSNGIQKTCEIKAWCPIENDTIISTHQALLKEVLDFTVLIRNTITFEQLNVQRSNLFAWTKGIINRKCIYNETDKIMKYCPIFKVSSLIGEINKKDLNELLTHGGIIRVIITWDCNLDKKIDECKPHYSFSRLYLNDGTFSKGWNFRYANYYELNNKEHRILYKVFGLRVLIEVRGKAGKFSPATLSMNIGSGFALLAIATVLSDFLITNCCEKKKYYYQCKYETHGLQELRNDEELKLANEIV